MAKKMYPNAPQPRKPSGGKSHVPAGRQTMPVETKEAYEKEGVPKEIKEAFRK